MDLNPKASIAEVAAGSGSALGQFGSPTMMKRMVKNVLASPNLNMSSTEQFVFSQAIINLTIFVDFSLSARFVSVVHWLLLPSLTEAGALELVHGRMSK